MAFCRLMFNDCKLFRAIERYAGSSYIQHNPHMVDGKQAFIDIFERMSKDYLGKHVSFKRSVAEGNLVVLHCHQEWLSDTSRDWAGIDIFHFDNDSKIVNAGKCCKWRPLIVRMAIRYSDAKCLLSHLAPPVGHRHRKTPMPG